MPRSPCRLDYFISFGLYLGFWMCVSCLAICSYSFVQFYSLIEWRISLCCQSHNSFRETQTWCGVNRERCSVFQLVYFLQLVNLANTVMNVFLFFIFSFYSITLDYMLFPALKNAIKNSLFTVPPNNELEFLSQLAKRFENDTNNNFTIFPYNLDYY